MHVAQGYLDVGVSATKEDVRFALRGQSRGLYPGAFCQLFEDPAGSPEHCVCVHADGAGTKSNIAYMAYRETGNAAVFQGIAHDSAVMNLDDMSCVGAVDEFLLSNTIGRNAHRITPEILEHIIRGYAQLSSVLAGYGITVKLVGGETADIGDLVSTVVVDSTVVARLARRQVIDSGNIKQGHVIVGLSSYGKASYESAYNSGIGSNGLSRARHLLLDHDYARLYPETVSSTIAAENVYQGRFRLLDRLPGSDQTVAEALLSPTRTYLPIIKEVLRQRFSDISGLVHCTGGGLVKVKGFGAGLHYVKNDLFETPPIFRAMLDTGNLSVAEAFNVFNMGHRYEIYCEPAAADSVVAISRSFGVDSKVIGEVRPSVDGGNKVTIVHGGQEFTY